MGQTIQIDPLFVSVSSVVNSPIIFSHGKIPFNWFLSQVHKNATLITFFVMFPLSNKLIGTT